MHFFNHIMINNGDAGDLRRHRAHYDVTVVENGLFSVRRQPSSKPVLAYG